MTIEEAKAWLQANRERFAKFDDVDDMPPDIKESRLLGPDSQLTWRRLLRELQDADDGDESDSKETADE
jgi:hypothetical protein